MTERLLIFAPNWLGDAVMALPAVARVARATASAAVDVAARPSVAPLFSMVDAVRTTIVLDRRSADADRIREGRYDAALLLPNSFNIARLAWRAGIAERWGYRGDFRNLLLTRGVSPPMRVHQTEYDLQLIEALGVGGTNGGGSGGQAMPGAQGVPGGQGVREGQGVPGRQGMRGAQGLEVPRLTVSDDQRARGAARLTREGWDGRMPLVAMAPGAAFGGAKRWPAASFAALASSLSADGVRTVLVGSTGDAPGASEMVSLVRGSLAPMNLVGRTDLTELAAILVHCRALVTNDSGAMHFAAALGVNVTAMFGPTRERDTHPRGPGRHAVLTNPTWCRPCMLRECPLTHRCMTGIAVDSVLNATRSFLA